MRILHSSDWHLGHQLHQTNREYEFRTFVDWVLETAAQEAPDAFLIAGDIFDTANPPNWATRLWNDCLAGLRDHLPKLDIVVIGGNHDSPTLLESTQSLLQALKIHVIGGVPWLQQEGKRALDVDRLLFPLHDATGTVQAWVVGMPFIRMSDLTISGLSQEADGDPLVQAVEAIYAQAIEAARERMQPSQRLIGMGHAYMRGGKLSEWSERKVLGGNQHAIPVSIFPEDIDYVALGHLHLAQTVGGRETVRYSGAPLPLSFGEANYPHQMRLISWQGDGPLEQAKIKVAKPVDFIRVPEKGEATLEEIEALLADLPERGDAPLETLPYLEVRVLLKKPEADLRRRVTLLLEDKAVRLLKVSVHYQTQERKQATVVSLHEIKPEQLFRQKYTELYKEEPSPELMAHFHQVCEEAEAQS